MAVAETFKALGDPVRLAIIERLSSGSVYTLGSVSQDFRLLQVDGVIPRAPDAEDYA